MDFQLTKNQIDAYQKDGYLVVSSFLSKAETKKLYKVATVDPTISKHSYGVNDQTGKKSKLALWYVPGEDVYGRLARSQHIVHGVNDLMEGDSPVCHYHSKLMQKEPKVGGAWEWHQDYGYWYKNEFLLPEQMMSVMVAVTKASRENGCLQVIKGSHKMGRIEHGVVGEQVGASQHYVDLALKTMELIYVELDPGDVLFFHSNILHRSEANLSGTARWSLISCYNRQANVPYNERSTSCTTPLEPLADTALLEKADRGISRRTDFLRKETDISLK